MLQHGEGSSYAVTSDGKIYSWGYNGTTRLGHGDSTNRNVPTQIAALASEKIIKVSSSYGSAGVVTEDGRVYTWGYGGYGALGTGNAYDQSRPILIDISDVKSVEMGWYYGGALKNNGDLYLWGTNLEGEIGIGTTGGTNYKPTLVPGISNIKQFSCGARHTLAVTNSGDLYAWGYNAEGEIGDNTVLNKNKPVQILSGTKLAHVRAAYNYSMATDEQGNVYSWGYNDYGKLGLNDATTRLVPTINPYRKDGKYVYANYTTTLILSNDNKVYGMGYNVEGTIGDSTTVERRIPTLWKFSY